MPFVRLAFFPDGTVEQYDALRAALAPAPRPEARLLFAAGPVAGGWQVVQVWQSRSDLEAYNREWFLPALATVGAAGFPRPPVVTDLEPVDLDLRADGL